MNTNNKYKTKTNFRLLVLLALVVIIFTVIFLYKKVEKFSETDLYLEKIEITGASVRAKNELAKKTQLLKGRKIADINIQKIKQDIINISWINNVSVWKVYPSTLKIKVVERNPLLIFENDNSQFYIINSEGNIVRKARIPDYKKLIIIQKGKIALDQSSNIRFILYQHPQFLSQVAKMIFNKYRWDLQLKNGIIVKMPEHNIEKAIKGILKNEYKYQILERDIKIIDARIPNKLFILPN